jgi:hypothetical protein
MRPLVRASKDCLKRVALMVKKIRGSVLLSRSSGIPDEPYRASIHDASVLVCVDGNELSGYAVDGFER